MASKQLEIVIKAKNEASAALKQVGNDATATKDKVNAFDSLVGDGKGLRSMFKQLKAIALLATVAELALPAVTAGWTALTGSAEESAAAQQELIESMKGVPIVGKLAAKTATFLGDSLAKALGKETTAEVVAGVEAKKKALEDFAKAIQDAGKKVQEANFRVRLSGLSGDDKELEQAKIDQEKRKEEISALKKASNEGARNGADTSLLNKQIKQLTIASETEYQRKVAAIRAKAAAEQKKRWEEEDKERYKVFNDKFEQQKKSTEEIEKFTRDSQDKIRKIQDDGAAEQLTAQGRTLAAKLLQIRNGAAQEIAEVERTQKEQREKFGNLNAFDQQKLGQANASQIAAIKNKAALDAQKTKQDALKKSQEDLGSLVEKQLAAQAEAGDELAKKKLAELQLQKDINDERQKLNEIIRNTPDGATRDAAKEALKNLNAGEATRKALAGLPEQNKVVLPGLQESRFLTGVGAAAAERQNTDPQVAALKAVGKTAEDQRKLQQRLVELFEQWLRTQGGGQGIPVS